MAQPAFTDHCGVWTEVDLDALPDDGNRYETLDGSLHVTPPADDVHHEVADAIARMLSASAPPQWRVVREVGVRVPAGNLIPDLVVLRPGAARGVVWREPGDVALAVEVESPSSRIRDRNDKRAAYAEAGIPAYWRVAATTAGPVCHLHTLSDDGTYLPVVAVGCDASYQVSWPYEVSVAPADWRR